MIDEIKFHSYEVSKNTSRVEMLINNIIVDYDYCDTTPNNIAETERYLEDSYYNNLPNEP